MCSTPPKVSSEYPDTLPPDEVETEVLRGVKRTWTLMGMGVTGLLAMTISTVVDITVEKGLSWSLYVCVGILCGLIVMAGTFFLLKKPLQLFSLLSITVAGVCLLLDAIVLPLTWSLEFALPITGLLYLLFGSWIYFSIRLRTGVVTRLVSFLVVSGVFCLLLDWRTGESYASWSIPVCLCFCVLALGVWIGSRMIRRNERWRRVFDL